MRKEHMKMIIGGAFQGKAAFAENIRRLNG